MSKRNYEELLDGEVDLEISGLREKMLKTQLEKVDLFNSEERSIIDDFFNHLLTLIPTKKYVQAEIIEAKTKLLGGEKIDEITLYQKSDRPFIDEYIPLIHHSILTNHIDMFKMIIKHTEDVNLMTDRSHNTQLTIAAAVGNLTILRALLNEEGVDIEALNVAGLTVLGEAYASENYEVVRELLKYGVSLKYSRDYSFSEDLGYSPVKTLRKIEKLVKYVDELCHILSAPDLSTISLDNILLLNRIEEMKNKEDIYSTSCARLEHSLFKNSSEFENIQTQLRFLFKNLASLNDRGINISYQNFGLLNKYFGNSPTLIPSLKTLSALKVEEYGDFLSDDLKEFYDNAGRDLAGLISSEDVD